MLQAILLAPLCVLMSVSTGTKTNRTNTIQRPEPSTLQECEWSMLYEYPNIDSDPVGDPATLGGGSATNYCQANINSSGNAASIGWIGSLTLSDNTFGLAATGVAQIPNSWGLFVYGTNPFNAPFYNGYLCVSPFPPGLFKVSPMTFIGGDGRAQVGLDLTHLPAGGEILAGSTWRFQFWFRDNAAGGAGMNLSDAAAVRFCP